MAHLLDFSKGFAGIALAEHTAPAWHGYGNWVGDTADLEEWQRRAGADYTVAGRKLFYAGVNVDGTKGKPVLVPDRKALVRSDTGSYLSTVGSGYEVLQPKQLFDFQRQVISAAGAKMDTAGVLSNGRVVWTLSKVDKSFTIKGQDHINTYILGSTSYDGTQASRFQFVTVRVVCNNTLQIALNGSKYGYIAVSHSTTVDVEKVAQKLLNGEDDVHQFIAAATDLSEVIPSNEQIAEFIGRVIPNAFRLKDGQVEVNQVAAKVLALRERGLGANLRSAKGTAWGLVNAITEYVDHEQRSKDQGTRLASAWFGQGADRKATAFAVAKELFLSREAA